MNLCPVLISFTLTHTSIPLETQVESLLKRVIGPGRREAVGREKDEGDAQGRGRVAGFSSVVISSRPTVQTVGRQVAVAMVTTGVAELSKCGKLQRQKVTFTILLVEKKIWLILYVFFS